MLASICPLGERARRQRYAITVTAFFAGSITAAAALGGALGAFGAVLGIGSQGSVAVALLATAAATGLMADLVWRGRYLPGPRRQVNEDWLATTRGWVYGAGFGAQLGLGVTTYVTVSAVYVTLAGSLLSGTAWAGALVGAAFGLARALPILWTASVGDPVWLRRRMGAFAGWRRRAHGAVLTTQAMVACVAVLGVMA